MAGVGVVVPRFDPGELDGIQTFRALATWAGFLGEANDFTTPYGALVRMAGGELVLREFVEFPMSELQNLLDLTRVAIPPGGGGPAHPEAGAEAAAEAAPAVGPTERPLSFLEASKVRRMLGAVRAKFGLPWSESVPSLGSALLGVGAPPGAPGGIHSPPRSPQGNASNSPR